MRLLTVRQPWAWAIIHGGKDVENRIRNLAGDYRGPVAIHAGLATFEDEGQYWEVVRAVTSEQNGWRASDSEVWSADGLESDDPRFVYGAIIGVVDLTDAHLALGANAGQINTCAPYGLCSTWAEPDVWHLALSNPRPLTTPIPYKGSLALRYLDEATTAGVLEAIA